MKKYILTKIPCDEADKIVSDNPKIWEYVCENRNGECYWNNQTGELLWIPLEEDTAKFSKLNTQVQN